MITSCFGGDVLVSCAVILYSWTIKIFSAESWHYTHPQPQFSETKNSFVFE